MRAYLVSNDEHAADLGKLIKRGTKLGEAVDIYSYEVRSMKPAPGIYEAMEAMAGAKGADLVYLDDRLENIEAGAARGWQALLHADPAVTVPKVSQIFGLVP